MPFVVEVLKQRDMRVYANTTQTTRTVSANSTWVNLLTVSGLLKLVKSSLVVVRCQIYASHSQNTNVCCQNSCIRIGFVDSANKRYHVGGYGWRTYNTTATYTYDFQGFAVLPAETYNLVVDVSAYDYAYITAMGFNNLYVGVVELTDLFKVNSWSQNVSAASKARTEFGSTTIPILTRKTVAGLIKNAALFVFCGVDANIWYGDGAASNWAGFQIAVDDVWISSPNRKMESQVENTAAFHWAQVWQIIDASKSHTVKFRLSNGTASTVTYTFHCGVIACPWLVLSDTYYPIVDVKVPVGSTIYGAVEDCFELARPKYAAIIRRNVINGDTIVQEFAQGTGAATPLSFSYTPEWYEAEIFLNAKSLWTCLSRLACDLRG